MTNTRIIYILILGLIAPTGHAENIPDGKELLEALGTSSSDIAKLESGSVVQFNGAKYEMSSRELATDATVLIKRKIPVVLSQLEESDSIVPSRKILASGKLSGDGDFSGIFYEDSEKDNAEVTKLINAKPGSDFNFSKEEWDWVQQHLSGAGKQDAAKQRQLASEAMQHIMQQRYLAYRDKGLEGISPVLRKRGKELDVSEDFRKTNATHQPTEVWFPEYYKVLTSYPEGQDCCTHTFRWLKVKIAKRPTFALTHSIIQEGDDYLLYTERFYYLDNAGNYGQVVLAWLPYADDTYMGLAMSANTEVLDSLLGKMLRSLGRNMAGDLVGDVLEDIKTDLEAGETPDGNPES